MTGSIAVSAAELKKGEESKLRTTHSQEAATEKLSPPIVQLLNPDADITAEPSIWILDGDIVVMRYKGIGSKEQPESVYWVFWRAERPDPGIVRDPMQKTPLPDVHCVCDASSTESEMCRKSDESTGTVLAEIILRGLAFVQAQAFQHAAPRVAARPLASFDDSDVYNLEAASDRDDAVLDVVLENSFALWWEIGSRDSCLQSVYQDAQSSSNSRVWREQALQQVQLLRGQQERIRDIIERIQGRSLNVILFTLTLVTIIIGVLGIAVAIVLASPVGVGVSWSLLVLALVSALIAIKGRRWLYGLFVANARGGGARQSDRNGNEEKRVARRRGRT